MVESAPALRRELRFWHLVLLNISAVAGIRWLAAAAHAGPGSITLWLLAVIAFLIPSALVVSSLSERFPEEGGFYVWTKRAFGEWHGFQCAWLYILSNIIYFPTLLLSGVAMAGYMFGTSGARYSEAPFFAVPATLTALWLSFLAHLVGLRVGKWTSILGGGSTYLIAALLVAFAVLVFRRYGSATHFQFIPQLSFDNLNLWSQIAFAMVGLEVAPILGGEIQSPRQTVPRAAWVSGGRVRCFMLPERRHCWC
jgi:glutamate:GABA antiporter